MPRFTPTAQTIVLLPGVPHYLIRSPPTRSAFLMKDSPTRVPPLTDPPLLIFVTDGIDLEARLRTYTQYTALRSDHIPITVTLDFFTPHIPEPRRTLSNFRKADWATLRGSPVEPRRLSLPLSLCRWTVRGEKPPFVTCSWRLLRQRPKVPARPQP